MDDYGLHAVASSPTVASLPPAMASSNLESLGHWPQFVSSANVMAHLPFIAWLVENVPHSSVLAVGGEVETGYFSICQSLSRTGDSSECAALGRWSSPEGLREVPYHLRRHNELHYGDFSSIAVAESPQATLEMLGAEARDIVFFELEGRFGADVDLGSSFHALRDHQSVVLLNLPRSDDLSRARGAWARHLQTDQFAFLEGPSTLMVGLIGDKVPRALAPLLSADEGRFGLPLDLQNLFRSLGGRNLRLRGEERAQAKGPPGAAILDLHDRMSPASLQAGTSRPSADSLLTTVLSLAESERRTLAEIYTAQIDELKSALVASPGQDQRSAPDGGPEDDRLTTIIAELETQLAATSNALAEERRTRFVETATLTRMLEENRQHVDELESTATQRSRRLQVLRDQLSRGTSDAAAQAEELSKTSERLIEMTERESEMGQEVARLAGQLKALRSSRSWRITVPLRYFHRLLNRVFRNQQDADSRP